MSETRAYELAAAYASDNEAKAFSGGSVALGDGASFDVGKALEDGNGTIATKDPQIINALDNYPALKRVAASEAEGVEPVGDAPDQPAGTPAVKQQTTRKAGSK